jgi:hypothetical protein
MYVYAPALEVAAPTVFIDWLRAWLWDSQIRFGHIVLSPLANIVLTA